MRFLAGLLAACLLIPLAQAQDSDTARSVKPIATSDQRAVAGAVDRRDPALASTPKFALVIGNADYAKIRRLKNPINDARGMCKALADLGFEVACYYDLPTKAEMRQAVRKFAAQLSPRTASFIYYAGHGVQINGENFLLPTSVSAEASLDLEDDSLNLNYLLRSLEGAKSSPNIVVLDACRENPFTESKRLSTGLARIDPPPGTVLVYATAPNRQALDGKGDNGLFTKHLLAHIGEPGPKLDELFQRVSLDVEREARAVYDFAQVPYRSSSFSGDYCLAGCENPAVAAKMAEIARQREEAAQRIERLNEENARLKLQTEERARNVALLESKIAQLSSAAAAAGAQTSESRGELQRLRASLQTAQEEQAAAERLKAEIVRRDAEVAGLQQQMQLLKGQSAELEKYRERVAVLERENADKARVTQEISDIRHQSEEAAQRVRLLMAENARLREQAQAREDKVAALEQRIQTATRNAESAGTKTAQADAELDRLRQALLEARDEQKRADAANQSSTREYEIASLKAQIATYQARADELEQLRQRILALEKTNADQKQQLSDRDAAQKKARPAIIPSF